MSRRQLILQLREPVHVRGFCGILSCAFVAPTKISFENAKNVQEQDAAMSMCTICKKPTYGTCSFNISTVTDTKCKAYSIRDVQIALS